MAHIVPDRVQENASTIGTGTFTLTGAIVGKRSMASQLTVDGDTMAYLAVNGAEWEIGLGTRVSATTLSRVVLSSSNANALVNFTTAPLVTGVMPGAHLSAVTKLIRATDQSITTAIDTAVSWSSETENNVTTYAGGNPTRITVPAGFTKIRITMQAAWASNSTGNRWLRIAKNGVTISEGGQIRVAAVESLSNGTYGWAPCVAGDYFEVIVQQTSGAALNLTGSGGVSARVELR